MGAISNIMDEADKRYKAVVRKLEDRITNLQQRNDVMLTALTRIAEGEHPDEAVEIAAETLEVLER